MLLTVIQIGLGYLGWFVLPGYLLARAFHQTNRFDNTIEKIALVTAFSAFVVPAALFILTALAFRPLDPAAAFCFLALCLLIFLFQHKRNAWSTFAGDLGQLLGAFRTHALVLAFAALALTYQFFFFDTVMDFHFTCTYFPCQIPAGHALDPAISGMPAFGQMEGENTSLYFAGHQRMGVTAVLSPALVLFGLAGLRLQWGMIMALLPLTLFALALRIDSGKKAARILAALGCLLPFLLFEPDQNRLVLSLTSVIALLAASGMAHLGIVGALLGLLYGAEPLAILGFGALIPLLYKGRGESSFKTSHLARLAVGFALGIAPFLMRYALAFGHPFFHEHFSYIPEISYRLFGISFDLPAFLGWPLRDQLVRSFYNPYPNLVLLPLAIERHFGLLLMGMSLVGFGALVRKRRWGVVLSMLLFFLPIAGFLALNENWTQRDKWSIVSMAYLPLFLTLGYGFSWFFEQRRRLVRWGIWAGAIVLLALIHLGLVRIDAPEDKTFQKIWGTTHQAMPPEEPFYVDAHKDVVGSMSFLPWTFEPKLPSAGNLSALREQLTDTSLFHRTPSTAELFMTLLADATLPAMLPEGVSRSSLQLEFSQEPFRGEVDLSTAPHQGMSFQEPTLSRTLQCGPIQERIDLHPFDEPIPIEAAWSKRPLLVSLIVDRSKNFGALVLIRTVLLRDTDRFFFQPPVQNPCLRLHLPKDFHLALLDLVSMDPNLSFAYGLSFGDDGVAALRFFGP